MTQHNPPSEWSRIFLIFGVGVVSACQIGKTPPVLPLLGNELGLTLVMLGWVVSSFNVLAIVIAPTAGVISDWLGHRRMILVGLAFLAIGSLTGSFATEIVLLIFSRVIEGLGHIIVIVSMPGLLLKVVQPQNRRIAFGILASCMPAGTALMMSISPILATWLGWRGLWRINFVVLVIYGAIFIKLTQELNFFVSASRRDVRSLAKDFLRVVVSPGPIILAIVFFTYAFQFLTVIGFLPLLFIEKQSLSPNLAAFMTAMILVLNIVGSLTGGWLLQSGIKRWTLISFASLMTGICCLGMFSPYIPLSMAYILCLIYGTIGGILPVTVMEGASTLAPEPSLVSTCNGLIVQIAQIGAIMGPPTSAAIAVGTGSWQSTGILLFGLGLVGLALAFRFRLVENRSAAK